MWSDNTYAQLKCFLTLLFMQEIVHPDGFHIYKKVNWFLPPVGHTYLEADRGFAQMARAAGRHRTIPSVEAFVNIAKTASPSNPAHCVQLEQKTFRDMTAYLTQFYSKKRSYKTTTGEKVMLRDVRWLNFGYGTVGNRQVAHHDEIWFRTDYDRSTPWKKIAIPRTANANARPLDDPAFQLFEGPLPLVYAKQKDLHTLVPLHFIYTSAHAPTHTEHIQKTPTRHTYRPRSTLPTSITRSTPLRWITTHRALPTARLQRN
jgi:hypothetical protein